MEASALGSIEVPVAFGIIATLLIVVWQMMRVIKAKHAEREPEVPSEVRDKSHKVANQATEVRAGLRRMSQQEDPLVELINAIHGKHKGSHGERPERKG